MGNQLLKNNKPPKDDKDGVVLRNKHNKKNGDFKAHRDKHQSCPEFGGAIPYNETNYSVTSIQEPGRDEGEEEDEKVKVEIKIYRSYGDLDRYRQELVKDQSNPDIRVYKRSSSSIAGMSSTASLPKDFGGKNLTKQQKKKLLNGDLGSSPSHGESADVEDSPDGKVSHEQKLSPQHRSAPNISVRKNLSSQYRFPGVAETKRKLKVFEDRFRKSLTFKFLSLDENRLLDILALARDLVSHSEVSVRQYLLGRGLSIDLPPDQFVLLMPKSLFKLLQSVRQDGVSDKQLWRSIARDIVTSVGDEVSRELSRIYEYQIIMLQEDVSIQLLASHAADCVLEFMTRKRALLHRNSALRGVVSAKPYRTENAATMFSVIIGNHEMKWDLFEILKMPGIRKDIYFKDTSGLALGMDSPFPWRFFVYENDCDPVLYGYRGQMLEWDFVNDVYRMYPEEKLYTDEKSFDGNNYHMQFVPYKVLVNVEIMREYLEHIVSAELPNRPNVSLTDFYKHVVPYAGDNRQQQMVYRPLSQLGANYTWRGAVLENMDLIRVNLGDHPGECQSLHGSVLLLADCRDATISRTDMEGCDLSYATIGGTTKLPANGHATDPAAGNGTRFLLLEDQMDDQRNKRDLIMDEDGKSMPPSEVILTRLKALPNISPEKDSFSSLDHNYNMAAHNKASRETQGEKRRSSGSGVKQRKPKQRRVQSHTLGSTSRAPGPQHDRQSTPSNQYLSDSSQSPTRSDILTSSSDALEKGEIAYADAVQSFAELKAKRAGAPILSFPPPPTYSPDKQSQDSTVSPASSSTSHPMSIESQIEAFMKSPLSSQPTKQLQSQKPAAIGAIRTTPRGFKRPIRKRACLKSIEESPGAVLMGKVMNDLCQLYGRDEETNDITDAIVMNTRLVTITGCPGQGKSSLAIAASRRLHRVHDMLPIYVNLRGCLTSDQVRAKVVQSLGLRLTRRYFDLVGTWLGSHNKKIILLLDNLDLPMSELDGFADLLPALLSNNKVYLLCTSRKAIFGGDYGVTDYKLGDIEEASCDLLRDMVPDLPDSCVQELASVCGFVPYTVCLVGSALKHPDVSAQQLYQTLLAQAHASINISNAAKEMLANMCAEEDKHLLFRLFTVVETVVQQMPSEVRRLLSTLNSFQGPFDRNAAKAVIKEPKLEARLPDFPYNSCTCYGGLLDRDATGELLAVPQLVKVVMHAQSYGGNNSNSNSAEFKYYTYYINKVARLCQLYHSKDHSQALEGIWKDYPNILDALKRAMYDSRELYESCSSLATPDMCIFLYEALEESDYLDLYQCLMDVTKQWVDTNVDRRVLCCFAYFHLRGENFPEASSLVNEAMELFPKASPNSGPNPEEVEVFAILLGLYRGVLDWKMDIDEEDEDARLAKEESIEKIKRAIELLKQTVGLQHALTIYAYETYALIEKDRGNYQKSRHYYNILDFIGSNVLGRHPALLDGYDARRAIWERQGLFCRATDVAQKAAEVAREYHGEHPFTAELFMKYVDCLIKVGDIPEASHAADVALCIRERLYGDHIETVLSHKMVAYLNLRCGLFEEAVKHAHRALEISRRLRVHSAYLTDIETILTQAQKRKEVMDSSMESKDSNANIKKHKVEVHNKANSLYVPSQRPQKPLRSMSATGCRRDAVPLHKEVRASLSTAV